MFRWTPLPGTRAEVIGRAFGLLLIVAVVVGCGTGTSDQVPKDLKDRMPAPGTLHLSLSAAGSATDTIGGEVKRFPGELDKKLGPLSLLTDYLEDGGALDRDIGLVVSLTEPPHVADTALRYRRGGSRLDVERFSDHVFYYLQVPIDGEYQPDAQIAERGMLIDGGSYRAAYGQRAQVTASSGRANADKGYLRIQFNQRGSERDALNEWLHIDYDLAQTVGDGEDTKDAIVYSFYPRPQVPAEDGQLKGVYHERMSTGAGYLYVSESRAGKVRWRWRAAWDSDGNMVVLGPDGSLAGCYDGAGAELGNSELPEPCDQLGLQFAGYKHIAGVFP